MSFTDIFPTCWHLKGDGDYDNDESATMVISRIYQTLNRGFVCNCCSNCTNLIFSELYFISVRKQISRCADVTL